MFIDDREAVDDNAGRQRVVADSRHVPADRVCAVAAHVDQTAACTGTSANDCVAASIPALIARGQRRTAERWSAGPRSSRRSRYRE